MCLIIIPVINPAIKLRWFSKFRPNKIEWAKTLFKREVRNFIIVLSHGLYSVASFSFESTRTMPRALLYARHTTIGPMNCSVLTPLLPTPTETVWKTRWIHTSVIHKSASDLSTTGRCVSSIYFIPSELTIFQENQLRYPTVFAMALDILPIQGSSVPCERVFSSSAETDTARRNRIAPELMEALQMLKFTIKQARELNFTAGTAKEDEIQWLEGLMEDQALVPEDITSFVALLLGDD